jgi:tRNA(Arg) A34 adenosine deaminase TadA
MSVDDEGARIAFEEAQAGLAEGGVPVGSAIVNPDGKILGRGRNLRSIIIIRAKVQGCHADHARITESRTEAQFST